MERCTEGNFKFRLVSGLTVGGDSLRPNRHCGENVGKRIGGEFSE